MTRAQRTRLAKEARRLAYECVNGTAPSFGVLRLRDDTGKPCRAMGHVIARAGLSLVRIDWTCFRADYGAVTGANDSATKQDRHARVVFPLLALADALEEAP